MEKCNYHIDLPIFNIIMKNRLFTKLYVFIGRCRYKALKRLQIDYQRIVKLDKREIQLFKKKSILWEILIYGLNVLK